MSGLIAAITPYLVWIALGTGVTAGGAVVGYVQQVRVGHLKNEVQSLKNEGEQLRNSIADRDKAIGEFQRSQRTLVASAEKCSASVASLAERGQERQQEVARLAEQVRTANAPILRSIASLTASLQAPGASARTCADALAQWRAEVGLP